jgi:nucleotide-binding universal stress UspA family protein
MVTEQDRETAQIDATAYLTDLAHSDLFAGISTTAEVVFGQPAPQILAFIKQRAVSLIVLCRTGRPGFLRWALGSVAQRIIHHSRVPMLVLQEGGSAFPVYSGEATHLPCVAVALDGSPLAEAALLPAAHLAAALAQPAGGVLQLLHVVKTPTSVTNNDALTTRDVEEVEQAQAYLQQVREQLLTQTGDLNLQITCSVPPSYDVSEAIVSATEKGRESREGSECDVLAMATHGRGGVELWVMGSVTERVLNTTSLPMLIVRP